jgi:uncharacterized protein (DUF924 family)
MEPEPAWVDDVLSFWFAELDREAWFRKSESMDALIRERFGKVHEQVAALPIDTALASPRRALAAVVVLDQFSRNLFRGTPRAFDSDPNAREIARSAIARSFDQGFDVHGRSFLYMPFEHSEDAADQELAVSLLGALGDEEYTRFAIAHRDIIARFGRFPHRNAVLGRASTPEEAEFLRQPGSSF